MNNSVPQGGILSPELFNIYIDGLNNIFFKSSICGSIDGKRINHMLYADDHCIVSLSSAGLQKLLSICDQYCAMHSITFNVKKSVCAGASPGFGRGGAKNFFFRFGNLHVAKRHAAHGEAMRFARGVRGHATPRNFFKMVQFGALWCIF